MNKNFYQVTFPNAMKKNKSTRILVIRPKKNISIFNIFQ